MLTKVEFAASSYVNGTPGTLTLATTAAQAGDLAVLIVTLIDQDLAAGWDTGLTVLRDGVTASAGVGKLWAAWAALGGNETWNMTVTPGNPDKTPIGHVSVWRDAAIPSASRPESGILIPTAGAAGSFAVVCGTGDSGLTGLEASGWIAELDSSQTVTGQSRHIVKSRENGPAGRPYLVRTNTTGFGVGYVVQPDLAAVVVHGVLAPRPGGSGF